jgi:hypothetical protein
MTPLRFGALIVSLGFDPGRRPSAGGDAALEAMLKADAGRLQPGPERLARVIAATAAAARRTPQARPRLRLRLAGLAPGGWKFGDWVPRFGVPVLVAMVLGLYVGSTLHIGTGNQARANLVTLLSASRSLGGYGL